LICDATAGGSLASETVHGEGDNVEEGAKLGRRPASAGQWLGWRAQTTPRPRSRDGASTRSLALCSAGDAWSMRRRAQSSCFDTCNESVATEMALTQSLLPCSRFAALELSLIGREPLLDCQASLGRRQSLSLNCVPSDAVGCLFASSNCRTTGRGGDVGLALIHQPLKSLVDAAVVVEARLAKAPKTDVQVAGEIGCRVSVRRAARMRAPGRLLPDSMVWKESRRAQNRPLRSGTGRGKTRRRGTRIAGPARKSRTLVETVDVFRTLSGIWRRRPRTNMLLWRRRRKAGGRGTIGFHHRACRLSSQLPSSDTG